ncbi:hypothetical protein HYY72_01285 [Candidatus Woesearchaeota archaeon]|nr:hypothetical protein [Candidatus Woesearchaeota archaeon]
MEKVYSIVTHHKNTEEAADRWIENGVCAVGFCKADLSDVKSKDQLKKLLNKKREKPKSRSITELMKFLSIQKDDLIIAYQNRNIIAAIGKVIDGDYLFESNPKDFLYPHQKKVKWFENPTYFDKEQLSVIAARQLGKRGITVTELRDTTPKKLLAFASLVESNKYKSKNEKKEELIKRELKKHLKKEIGSLEQGLVLKFAEKTIGKKRPDFIAEDGNRKTVIIECKGSVDFPKAIKQIVDYRKRYKKQVNGVRCFLIAFDFDSKSKEKARKEGIEMFQAELCFKSLN